MRAQQNTYSKYGSPTKRITKSRTSRRGQGGSRMVISMISLTVLMILVCSLSYRAIKTDANSGFKYYTRVTIGAGETLWELSDDYIDYEHYRDKSSYISEVQHINHIEEAEALMEGQVLVVPYYSAEYVY